MTYTVIFKEESGNDVFDAHSWYESRRNGLEFFRSLNYPTNGFGDNAWPEGIYREHWTSKFWFL